VDRTDEKGACHVLVVAGLLLTATPENLDESAGATERAAQTDAVRRMLWTQLRERQPTNACVPQQLAGDPAVSCPRE
jgi:hypothetical protein